MSLFPEFQPSPFDLTLPGQEQRDIRILVLDDQEIIRLELKHILKKNNFSVLEASNAEEALAILDREPVDLLLSDIVMPGMTGLELMKRLKGRIPDIAVVMVSGLDNVEMALDCLHYGAYHYVVKPFKTSGILIAVANALRRRMLELEHRDREAILARKVREQTLEIRNGREEIAFRLLAACEKRDNETGSHVRRIGLYAACLAELSGWSNGEVECIQAAAPMHDLGKIGIPDRVLQKSGPLDAEEWEQMKLHTLIGASILKESTVPFIAMGASIAQSHHERFDGTGYPNGLAGEEISIEARITGLVDVFDALSCKRTYKAAWQEKDVLEYIRSKRVLQFDPVLVDLFLDHVEHFSRILKENPNI